MAEWHTTASVRGNWSNAPADDQLLGELLDVAKSQCLAWAPLEDESAPPTNHRLAQRLQVQAIWEAMKAAPSGDIGGEGYGVRIYDMGATIKRILLPPSPTAGLVG